MKEETRGNDSNEAQGPGAPKLSEEERALIAGRLNASRARRQKIRPSSVSVVVDGLELSHFDLAGSGELQLELEEGAKLVEIWGADEAGSLLLGTHLISYAGEAFAFSKVMQSLSNGKLDLMIAPIPSSGDGIRAVLKLSFTPRFQMFRSAFTRALRLVRLIWPPEDTRCQRYCEVSASARL